MEDIQLIKDGIHYLSGVGDTTVEVGWDDTTNGVVLVIDGEQYVAYEDPNDGYRSYGVFGFIDEDVEIYNTFPPQKVYIETEKWCHTEDSGWESSGYQLIISNPEDNSTILKVGTDTSDSWYPYCIFEWHPENLPINKNK